MSLAVSLVDTGEVFDEVTLSKDNVLVYKTGQAKDIFDTYLLRNPKLKDKDVYGLLDGWSNGYAEIGGPEESPVTAAAVRQYKRDNEGKFAKTASQAVGEIEDMMAKLSSLRKSFNDYDEDSATDLDNAMDALTDLRDRQAEKAGRRDAAMDSGAGEIEVSASDDGDVCVSFGGGFCIPAGVARGVAAGLDSLSQEHGNQVDPLADGPYFELGRIVAGDSDTPMAVVLFNNGIFEIGTPGNIGPDVPDGEKDPDALQLDNADEAAELAGLLEEMAHKAVEAPVTAAAGSDRSLREYWVHGKGSLAIRWPVEGAFKRCVRKLSKYSKGGAAFDPEGLCAEMYREANGRWPGSKKKNTVIETAAAARAYVRDNDGQFAHVPGSGAVRATILNAADKLKIGARAPEDHYVLSSQKVLSDDGEVGIAFVDTPAGKHVRIGPVGESKWDGGYPSAKDQQRIQDIEHQLETDENLSREEEDALGEELDTLRTSDTATLTFPVSAVADVSAGMLRAIDLGEERRKQGDIADKLWDRLDGERSKLISAAGPQFEQRLAQKRNELEAARLERRINLGSGDNWDKEPAYLEAVHKSEVVERELERIQADQIAALSLPDRDRIAAINAELAHLRDAFDDSDFLVSRVSGPEGELLFTAYGGDSAPWWGASLRLTPHGEDPQFLDPDARFNGPRTLRRMVNALEAKPDTPVTAAAARAYVRDNDGQFADVPGAGDDDGPATEAFTLLNSLKVNGNSIVFLGKDIAKVTQALRDLGGAVITASSRHYVRDSEGQFSHTPGVSVPGTGGRAGMRIAERFNLYEGESLRSLDDLQDDLNLPRNEITIMRAVVDGPDGPQIALGFIPEERADHWQGKDLGGTLFMNGDESRRVIAELEQVKVAGDAHAAETMVHNGEYDRLEKRQKVLLQAGGDSSELDAVTARMSEVAREQRDVTIVSGSVPVQLGSLEYLAEGTEGIGDSGWKLMLWVRPEGVDENWDPDFDSSGVVSVDGDDVGGFLDAVDPNMITTAAGYPGCGECGGVIPVEYLPGEHWHTVVHREGVSTGQRTWAPGSIGWREPPFAFHWEYSTAAHGGQMMTVQVGLVTRVQRIGDAIHAWGSIDLGAADGAEVARKLAAGFVRWVSMGPGVEGEQRPGTIMYDVVYPAGLSPEEAAGAQPEQVVFTEYPIGEITIVSVPAQEGTFIEPSPELLAMLGMTAQEDIMPSYDETVMSHEPLDVVTAAGNPVLCTCKTAAGKPRVRKAAARKPVVASDRNYVRDSEGKFAETPGGGGGGLLSAADYGSLFGNAVDERTVDTGDDPLAVRFFDNGDSHIVFDRKDGSHEVVSDVGDADAMRQLMYDIQDMLALTPDDLKGVGADEFADDSGRKNGLVVARDGNGDVALLAEDGRRFDLGEQEAQSLADALDKLADSWETEFPDGPVTAAGRPRARKRVRPRARGKVRARRRPYPVTAGASWVVEVPDLPEAWMFGKPDVPPGTDPVITDDGRFYGYFAPAKLAHRSYARLGERKEVKSLGRTDYTRWLKNVPVADGGTVLAGPVTMGCMHAPTQDYGTLDRRHQAYEDTCSIIARVGVGEDPDGGRWFAGVLEYGITAEQINALTLCRLSLDSQPHPERPGWQDFVAILAVPVAGWPTSVTAGGGVVHRVRETEEGLIVTASSAPVTFQVREEPEPVFVDASVIYSLAGIDVPALVRGNAGIS